MSIRCEISRKTLHDELATLVRTMIFEGTLRPGGRISEQRLCARFGVSRTPLREALKVLSAEGLVRLSPNKGATVARVTRQEVEEIIPILGILAGFAGELGCTRMDDSRVAYMRSLHEGMIDRYQQRDEETYHVLNQAFHQTIFDATGNKTLCEAYATLQIRLNSLMFATPKAPPRWAEALDDHRCMMEALEAQDGDRLAVIARRHIMHKADVVQIALDAIETRPSVVAN
jgi:DNA-binding GntR family transcriptional regulator